MVVSKNEQNEVEKWKDKIKVKYATWLKQMLTTRKGSLLGSFDSLRQFENKFEKKIYYADVIIRKTLWSFTAYLHHAILISRFT